MNKLRLNASRKLRPISAKTRRLFSAHKRRLVSVAVGAAFGAVIGGIIEGLDYAAFLADLHHRYGINPFEFGDLGYLAALTTFGAVLGAVSGIIGSSLSAFVGFSSAAAREIAIRAAGGVVIIGVVACVASVAMANYGITVVGLPDPLGAIAVGNLFIGSSTYAAGVVGAVRTDN
ncbi:hypothetical protein [Actinomadura mexicana]|uniref:Uncharacterized protein n=1 Tax=Actinomadura mexicana TaxID=134959 RepID=A0A238UUK4_9ACTN|nr:hypothetical protein [Actinomadura mexicana]SNR25043.1 hypothetical protein SAMN06265355_101363 [Actinomadura mexicana]